MTSEAERLSTLRAGIARRRAGHLDNALRMLEAAAGELEMSKARGKGAGPELSTGAEAELHRALENALRGADGIATRVRRLRDRRSEFAEGLLAE